MEFNLTSTKTKRRKRGFTLAELMVAAGISGIVLAALAAASLYTARSFSSLSNHQDLDQKSRLALDQMTKQIRQADGLASFTTNSLTFNHGTNGVLEYSYDPVSRELEERLGQRIRVLLTECDNVQFDVFQRNSISNTFSQFPNIVGTNQAKLVQVNWTCSREILGQKFNVEYVQSAKIVIRK